MPRNAPRAEQHIRMNYLVLSLVLLLVGTSIAIVQYKVPSIFESIMAAHDMTTSTGSWLMSVFTAMGIFLSLPTGALAKKLGPRSVLLLGCAIVILGSFLGAWATSAWLMIASRAVEGVAFVFISVAGPLAIEQYVDAEHQGTVNGVWALWICFGSVIGSTATPMVFEALGLTGTWLAYAAIVAGAAVLLAAVVRVPGRDAASEDTGNLQAAIPEASQVAWRDYRVLVRPSALLVFFAYVVFNAEILAVLSYAPTFLQGQGMNASLSGFASSLPGLLAAASSPIAGRLIDRTGRTKPFLMVALAVSGPATFLMLTQSDALLWVGAALMGFIGYGVPVASLTALPQIAGRRELLGVATGMLMLAMCLGEFLGSLVTPMLLGPAMTNWLFCGSVLLTAGLAATAAMAFCRIR
ncbi:MFS transporter [Gordonibacter pamelaeae]|nr:MFS transporter [Gordonibacter pamelaeae]